MALEPTPYGPIATARQLKWHQTQVYGFIHFCINTFTDKEWGFGDESPSVFNPTDFDVDQIVLTAKEAGLRGLVLTCKHHDGFCLWPSPLTEHSIKNSPWKNGEGDMVREFSEACKRHGLQFGVYLSPWDRNHPEYGRPAYLEYYRAQLRDLLTNYGPVFEVWFDGANGGDGYYGGANETRSINNETYYDWENTWQIVRELQPDACMFTDVGPDIRWVGNESGFAGDPCWSTIDTEGSWPGQADHGYLNRGDRNGKRWQPAEVDVSIRPGWFYHASEDEKVRSASNLMQIYVESVGRGANLILNLPPDRRGVIHENDVKSLREWRELLDKTFAVDFAQGATLTASDTRQGDAFSVAHLTEGNTESYWATDDEVKTPEVIVDFGAERTFNVVRLREHLPLGQRVDEFALDYFENGEWHEFAKAESIGNTRLIVSKTVTTSKLRLRITKAAACPAISELAVFAMPQQLDEPQIARDAKGDISIVLQHRDAKLHYTLDGSEPTEASPVYEAPFSLHRGGIVKTRAFLPDVQSPTVSASFEISKALWKVVAVSAADEGYPVHNAIDERDWTRWSTRNVEGLPQEIVVDMGETLTIKGFTVLPRQDDELTGTPDRYEFYVSDDNQNWGSPIVAGEFSNIRANRVLQTVPLEQPVDTRYFKAVFLRVVGESNYLEIAEVGVITR